MALVSSKGLEYFMAGIFLELGSSRVLTQFGLSGHGFNEGRGSEAFMLISGSCINIIKLINIMAIFIYGPISVCRLAAVYSNWLFEGQEENENPVTFFYW